MKPFLLFFVITTLAAGVSSAQTSEPGTIKPLAELSTDAVENVQFTTRLNNYDIAQDSTNILICKLVNDSTNTFEYSKSVLTICLTNSGGFGRMLLSPPSHKIGSFGADIPAISFEPLPHGETSEWSISFVIGEHVPDGSYQLKSNQIMLKSGTRKGWILTSDLNVLIK